MDFKSIKNGMRGFIVALAVIGGIFYAYAVPVIGKTLAERYPEFSHCYYPWLIFISITAIPCYIVLVELWNLSTIVGKDAVFQPATAKLFGRISLLACIDITFFFIMNVAFILIGMSHPTILIASIVVTIIGAAFSFCAKVASEYIGQAAKLQEESDLTI